MQSWTDFIAAQTLSADISPACGVTPLTDLGLIRVSGEDKVDFLQGQLTNDVTKVDAGHSQLSSMCSPKGRMMASFRVFQRGDDLFLLIPRDRLEAMLKRLQMFVLRSRVELADVSDELVAVGFTGECASDLLPLDPPTEVAGSVTQDGITIITLPGERPRFLVIAEADFARNCWEETVQSATPTGRDFWSLMDIRAGLPSVREETAEAFVPQMTNLQLVDGVGFTKGCYTGQEVVARMQYLGKLKRRMYRVHVEGAEPRRGMELYSASSDSGQGTGRIVDAAPSPDGGWEALAVIEISSADAGDVRLENAAGAEVEILELPYAFAEA